MEEIYNLRQSRLRFKYEIVMNEANCFFFVVQVLRRKSAVYIFHVPQGDDESNYKWRKDIGGENPKNIIFVYKIHYSKYQLMKHFA